MNRRKSTKFNNMFTWERASQVVRVVKNPPANAWDMRCGFDPWIRKIPWRRAWKPTQYSGMENSMDREAWQAIVHRVSKSWTRQKQLRYMHPYMGETQGNWVTGPNGQNSHLKYYPQLMAREDVEGNYLGPQRGGKQLTESKCLVNKCLLRIEQF